MPSSLALFSTAPGVRSSLSAITRVGVFSRASFSSWRTWYRFAGSPEAVEGGLTFKQQQLANAVCPLVTRAVAEYLLAL